MLEYNPSTLTQQQFKSPQKPSSIEKWNVEQINNFVRKLGFFDKEKYEEEDDKIKRFLHINEVLSP